MRKSAAISAAILAATLMCLLAVAGTSLLMRWLDARPEFVAVTQPWLHLTTLALVAVAAIRMAPRRAV